MRLPAVKPSRAPDGDFDNLDLPSKFLDPTLLPPDLNESDEFWLDLSIDSIEDSSSDGYRLDLLNKSTDFILADIHFQNKHTQEFLKAIDSVFHFHNFGHGTSRPNKVPDSKVSLSLKCSFPPKQDSSKRNREEPLSATEASKKHQNSLHIVHDELSMPANFRANPNNHARFKYYHDGTREYLNAPQKRRKRASA